MTTSMRTPHILILKDAYQISFAFWKDADSAIPILTQARAEYAKLQ